MKLGTLLLRNAAIGLSQLEAALRNQVLYGGRLGTNLVELGYLDLESLSGYLAELMSIPVATPTMLDAADRDLLDKLGGDEAHRLRAVPLGAHEGAIGVAMVDPTDKAALEQLTSKLGKKILPHIVPELRALYYLEKHFGLPRRARFVRTQRPDADADIGVEEERRRAQPNSMVMPPAFTLEPRRRKSPSQAPIKDAVPTHISYGAACERVDTAADREQIGDALLDYAKGRFDALVIFLIRDGNAMGWRGYIASGPKQVDNLSLPLGGASALQFAHDTSQTFNGPPPSEAKPIETQLWAALGADPAPVDVLVVPILVKGRAVNLVYAHVLGGAPAKVHATELADLAARAQQSYQRLIRQARGS